jgi:hypothetical protein
MRWSIEPATHGVGTWIVGRGDQRVDVVACPGSAIWVIDHSRGEDDYSPRIAGWRYVYWEIDYDSTPNLDRDDPDCEPIIMTTRDVLDLIDVRLHETVRWLLQEQLFQLEAMELRPAITQAPGFEHAAHYELSGIAWLRTELVDAFRAYYPAFGDAQNLITTHSNHDDDIVLSAAMPGTVAEFESRLHTTAYSRNLGGRELTRLLKRRIIWRILEHSPRRVLMTLLALTSDDWECHELVARWLKEQAFRADWPLAANVAGVHGPLRRLIAVHLADWQLIPRQTRDAPGNTEAEPTVLVDSHPSVSTHFDIP